MSFLGKLKQNKTINNILSLGSATLISAVFAFLVGIITRNVLGPEQYGYYLTVSLAFTFIPLGHLGMLNAMNREVPFYLVRQNEERVKEIRNLSFSFLYTFPLLLVVLLLITSISLFFFDINLEYKTGVFITVFISIFLFLCTYVEVYYNSAQKFSVVSKLMFIKSVIQSASTIVFVFWIGYEGLYLGILLASIIEVYIGRKSFQNLVFIFNIKKYKELIKIGFPILLVGLVWSLMIASDRIIIAVMMDPESVGNYGVGMIVFSTMMLLPQVIGQVLYPKIVELVSEAKYVDIKKYYWKINKILAFIMFFVVLAGYFCVPFFIEWFMPEYVEGIRTAQILILGIYPLTLVGYAANFFNSTQNQKIYIGIQIFTLLSNIILSIVFLEINRQIHSVALATSISYVLYFILMNLFFFKSIKKQTM